MSADAKRRKPIGLRRLKPADGAHHAVRTLFDEIDAGGYSLSGVAAKVGLNPRTIEHWREHDPGVSNLDAALSVVGLRLVVARIDN